MQALTLQEKEGGSFLLHWSYFQLPTDLKAEREVVCLRITYQDLLAKTEDSWKSQISMRFRLDSLNFLLQEWELSIAGDEQQAVLSVPHLPTGHCQQKQHHYTPDYSDHS